MLLDKLVDNDLKDVLLDKTNKGNHNMLKLNRIMLGMLLSVLLVSVFLILIFLTLNTLISNKESNRKYDGFRSVMAICELNDETVFMNTPPEDFEKIKSV